jgi:hypothetical protein
MAQPEDVAATAELMARNDASFREANERIESCVQSMDGRIDGLLPFLCECSDVTCTEIVRMTAAEYEAVREDSVRFTTVPGHEGGESWARVVDRNDRFAVVEKLGAAADVATELDARRHT